MKSYLQCTFGYLFRQKKPLAQLAFVVVADTVVRLVQPFLYKFLVDTLTTGLVDKSFTEGAVQALGWTVVIWFALVLSENYFRAQGHFLVWEIGSVSSQWMHMDGFRKLLRLDYLKHTKKHSSGYAKIVDQADVAVWEMSNWWLGRFFPSSLGFVGMLCIALSVSWQMTLVSLSVVPVGLGIIIFMINKYDAEQRRVNKLWNKKHEHLSDQITNVITYKLNQDEERFVHVQKGYSDRAAAGQTNLNRKWRLVEILNPDAVARFMVMALGVFLVKEGSITLGTLFMFMGLLNEILMPLHMLGDILPQYSRRAREIEKAVKLLDEEDFVVDAKKTQKLKSVAGGLEFQDVSFVYDEKDAKGFRIVDVSFVVKPGEHVAFVGHSGAGKSTVVALLTRLVDPTRGAVLLDGVDIRKYKQAEYRGILGTVLQEHSLYNETVAENIAYGKHNAKREEIIEAAKKAYAHEFIEKLPKGYDTLIGEKGVRLSGGQKQRLAIARAILKNPSIVILDEPTSALDSITEAKVQKGLQSLMTGRTTITIAHRLSTVRNADKIIMMRDGKLVALGSHFELLKSCPEYAEMVELQTGGFLADEDDVAAKKA